MVRRKEMSNGEVAVPEQPPPVPTSQLPSPLRFPLLVTLSLSLSSLLYSFSSDYTAGDLATVSRSLNEWSEVVGLIAWRTIELGIGWWGEFDSYDLASLTLLTHLPTLYLLQSFYAIRPTTVVTSLVIDLLATYIPFRLLRPVSPTHALHPPRGSVANRSILSDLPVRALTTLLAAAIYSLTIFASYYTWLPIHLVTSFDGLRDISAAHDANIPVLMATLLPVGYAAREFLFSPATGARMNLKDIRSRAFNPATATLGETVVYNLWGYSKRTRELIKRTAILVAVSGLNTWLQTFVTIEGTEPYGAAGWAAVWSAAAALTGLMYLWVGDVEGVSN